MNTKLATLASVFVISSLVYFSLLNQFVIQNTLPKAAGPEVTVSFLEDKITAPIRQNFDVNIFFNSTDEVDNGLVSFEYGPNLTYVRPSTGADYVSATCQANGFQFEGLIEYYYDNNARKGYIFRNVISGGTTGGLQKLPNGYFCHSTLEFRYDQPFGIADAIPSYVAFRDPSSPQCTVGDPLYDPLCRWDIFGPKGPFDIKLDSLKSRVDVVPGAGPGSGTIPTPTLPAPTSGSIILATPTPVTGLIPSPTPTKNITPTPTVTPKPIEFTCDACPSGIDFCDTNLQQKIMECLYGSQPPGFDCMTLDINGDGVIDAGDLSAAGICKKCLCTISPTASPTTALSLTLIPPTATTIPTIYLSPTQALPIATTIPLSSPTSIDSCPNVTKGNYDCSADGLTTLSDYEAFRVAFFKYNRQKVYTKTADGNQDGQNKLDDFEVLRENLTL